MLISFIMILIIGMFFIYAIEIAIKKLAEYFADQQSIRYLKKHFFMISKKYQGKQGGVHYCCRNGKIVRIV